MTDRSRPAFCFVLPWSFDIPGGVNEVLRNLIRQFATREDIAYTPLAMELGQTFAARHNASLGIREIAIALHSPYAPERPLRSFAAFLLHVTGDLIRLARIARHNNIAVFNFHFPDLQALTFVFLRMLRLFHGDVVLSIHGSDIRSAHAAGWFPKALWRFLLRHSTTVVACSNGLREEILLLEPQTRVITIYNGIDVELFRSEVSRNSCLPEGLERQKIIINIGSFEYRKGHDVLVGAFEEVARRHPNVALLLVGKPGPVSASVRDLIRERQLQTRIHILENVPHSQIFDLLARSDIFVLATRWRKGEMGEGFAIAILEAAAAKVPVVATASCGVEEIIVPDETGMIVPLEDTAQLASALCAMLENPQRARTMAEHLYQAVQAEFTWQRAADAYAGLSSTDKAA